MIFQRGKPIEICGCAPANSIVTVQLDRFIETAITKPTGRWCVKLPSMPASSGLELSAKCENQSITYQDICVGDVWLCSGQSNLDQRVAKGNLAWCGVIDEEMEVAAAEYPMIRLISIKLQFSDTPLLEVADSESEFIDPNAPPYSGEWQKCSPQTVGNFSATAYFFARELFRRYKVPVGMVVSCYGASTIQSWISRSRLEEVNCSRSLLADYNQACVDFESGIAYARYRAEKDEWRKTGSYLPHYSTRRRTKKPPHPRDPHNDQHSPCVMYNGMIAPLKSLQFRGAVWYHGESNQPTSQIYLQLLRMLIADWRLIWSDLFFIIVQLASINAPDERPMSRQDIPRIRDAQKAVGNDRGVATVVTIDLGRGDAHGSNKLEVGRRISLAAGMHSYGESAKAQGPAVESIALEISKVILYFKHADGLHASSPLLSFTASEDKQNFFWADAEVRGESVIVSCNKVSKLVEIRYAWSECPRGLLFNGVGLPASPFRILLKDSNDNE